MTLQLVLAPLLAAAVFSGLALMSNRKLGASVAQGFLALGGVIAFVAIVAGPVAGFAPRDVAGLAAGLIAASMAGMLYHFYLGRFTEVWAARGVFTAVFLGLWLVFGFVFLSLI